MPTRNSWSLVSRGTPIFMRPALPVGLDQDVGDLGPHDARVGPLSRAQLLAHLRAADAVRLLPGMALLEVDAAERLVERREADLAGPQMQLAGQRVEDVLGVEV